MTIQLQVLSSNQLVRDPWTMVPSLGNLSAYIAAVNNFPMLTAEEELTLARQWKYNNDVAAAGKLVLSHLRLVVSIARDYLNYGLPHSDLIQEGNVGLMKAVKKFDPDAGVRLVSYAMHWIKAEIHSYVLENWSMVKIATTKAQKKLFFNLNKFKKAFAAEEATVLDMTPSHVMTTKQAATIAEKLNVDVTDVLEMNTRMSGGDVVLDTLPEQNDNTNLMLPYLNDMRYEPTHVLEQVEQATFENEALKNAMETLDERSRFILKNRWLLEDDETAMTLHELAAKYSVSPERIRQIETSALKKMKTLLS